MARFVFVLLPVAAVAAATLRKRLQKPQGPDRAALLV